MSRITRSVLLLMLVALGRIVFPRAADYSFDGPIRFSDGPKELNEMLAHEGYLGGHFINQYHSLFYAGDTKALNEFLKTYSQVEVATTRTLILHPGRGRGISIGRANDKTPYDWAVGVVPGRNAAPGGKTKSAYSLGMRVYLGGGIDLRDLEVPLNVHVKSSGEIGRFIQKHEERRAAGDRPADQSK